MPPIHPHAEIFQALQRGPGATLHQLFR